MIRRDYFIKLIQEFSAVLLRIISLKARHEYAAALEEIDRALDRYLKLSPSEATPENLDRILELCGQMEGLTTETLTVLGDLFQQQGELSRLQENHPAARRADLLALGLYIESVGKGFVSLTALEKIDVLIQNLMNEPFPTAILQRLVTYLEARGLYDKAEDALFEWIERDPGALPKGIEFYDRLLAKSDLELTHGNLPRAEVQEGKAALVSRNDKSVQPG